MKEKKMEQLESLLKSETFSSLFFNSKTNSDSLWEQFGAETHLDVVKNSSINYSRLFASEILYAKCTDYPDDSLIPILCEIYSEAIKDSGPLASEVLLPANAWGFMYANDDIGYLGERLLSFKGSIIPSLMKLIDIAAPVLYMGSQDATIGNEYNYRVKDIAAFYIAKIKEIPITFYQDFEKRDEEIERLKSDLENECPPPIM